jgi:hypothetical protein
LAVYDYHVDRVYRDSGDAAERRRPDKRSTSLRVSIPYYEKHGQNNEESRSLSPYRSLGIAHQRSTEISDPLRAGGSNPPSWSLPFRSECPSNHPAEVALEFKRLDINGEGRLTYLTLKSALELRGVQASDSTIRKWLQQADRGGKGYVDFSDYQSLYKDFEGTFGREDSKSPVRPVRGSSVVRITDFSPDYGDGDWEGEGEDARIELLRR